MSRLSPDKRMLEYALNDACSDIFAFSTTRHGGVSTGTYASLNCTPYTGDSAENVLRNQGLLLEALPQRPQELVIPWQTHGTASLVIDTDYLQADPQTRHESLQGIDALITREPSVCLCISTADCIPILLYDHRHQAIAAVHAGWRGTVNRIVRHTLERMQTLYGTEGKDVQAVIGPGISLAAQLQLLGFGLPDTQIETAGICTYTRHEDFFSARRLGIKSGRMLSGIMINP